MIILMTTVMFLLVMIMLSMVMRKRRVENDSFRLFISKSHNNSRRTNYHSYLMAEEIKS